MQDNAKNNSELRISELQILITKAANLIEELTQHEFNYALSSLLLASNIELVNKEIKKQFQWLK